MLTFYLYSVFMYFQGDIGNILYFISLPRIIGWVILSFSLNHILDVSRSGFIFINITLNHWKYRLV